MVMRYTNGILVLLLLACGCSDADVDKISKVSGKAWGRARVTVNAADSRVRSGLAVSPSPMALERAATVDEDVVARLDARLKADWALQGANINVGRSSRGVTLTGTVQSAYQYRRAGDLARSTAGPGVVQNSLEVRNKS